MQRVTFQGRSLPSHRSLASLGLPSQADLELVPRLAGGGGDGGSTGAESRSSYLAMYRGKVPDKADPAQLRLARWTTCQLSGAPLSAPVVVDELGFLFNKDALVEALLGKNVPPALGHITSLKHVVEVKLHVESGDAKASDASVATYACPVSGAAMDGRARFVVHRASGLALSQRAFRDAPEVVADLLGLPAGGAARPSAEGLVDRGEAIPVNPPADELQARRLEAAARLAREVLAKKERKSKRKEARAGAGAEKRGKVEGGRSRADQGKSRTDDGVEGLAPKNADKKVWASLFTSSQKEQDVKETYLCRSTMSRGMTMS